MHARRNKSCAWIEGSCCGSSGRGLRRSRFFQSSCTRRRRLDSATRLLRLDRNESAYGPSEKARTAFQEVFEEVNRYPGDDVERLRVAVGAAHGVQPENVTLGCGSTELLRMAAEAFLGPGKNVVMASPTFEPVGRAAQLVGAEVRSTPLNHFYAHDLDAMLGYMNIVNKRGEPQFGTKCVIGGEPVQRKPGNYQQGAYSPGGCIRLS